MVYLKTYSKHSGPRHIGGWVGEYVGTITLNVTSLTKIHTFGCS